MEVLAASSSMKLIDAGRMSRRTIADAIEVMRSHPEFSQHRRSKVQTFPLHLPSGDVPFLVQVVCAELALTVSLPTSKKFRAKGTRTPASLEFEEFETCLLDGASAEIIDEQLEVVLSDGRRLQGVQVIPCYLPPCGDGQRQKDALRLQEEVIGLVVRMCNAQDRCYRYVDKDLFPGVRVLDFGTLRDLQLPPLSEIVNYIDLNHPAIEPHLAADRGKYPERLGASNSKAAVGGFGNLLSRVDNSASKRPRLARHVLAKIPFAHPSSKAG